MLTDDPTVLTGCNAIDIIVEVTGTVEPAAAITLEAFRSGKHVVLVNAEFGRTPAINKNAGRDHWPWVYSLTLAGAGVKAGTIYGASDQSAAYPTDKPHDPRDMAATIVIKGISDRSWNRRIEKARSP